MRNLDGRTNAKVRRICQTLTTEQMIDRNCKLLQSNCKSSLEKIVTVEKTGTMLPLCGVTCSPMILSTSSSWLHSCRLFGDPAAGPILTY
jgi:hypothetical protein